MSLFDSLGSLIEKTGSIYIAGESIKAQSAQTAGNDPSDYQKVQTGVNSDGSTLLSRQLVAGVPNSALLGGALLLLVVAAGYWAVAND